jgi:hypothetical protein
MQEKIKKTAGKSRVPSTAVGKPDIEPMKNRFAVRYREGNQPRIARGLAKLGQVQEVKPQRLLLVEFADQAHSEAAQQQLQHWTDDGSIEFATPMLRDPASDSARILTDEITVRFKSALPEQRLKQFARKYGVTIARQNEFVPTQYIVKVDKPEGLQTLDIAHQLDESDDVEFATPNFISEYRR